MLLNNKVTNSMCKKKTTNILSSHRPPLGQGLWLLYTLHHLHSNLLNGCLLPIHSEGLNSPLPLEFSSTNLWKMSSEATSMDTPNLLQVNHKIPTSSSFEDISGVTKNDLEKAPLSISSSNTSLNESESSSSSAFDLNLTRHNQEDFRKEMEIYQRRSRFQHRSSSSSSKGSLDESVGASFNNSSPSDSSEKFKLKRQQTIDMLVERRRRPAPFHTSSGTDISLSHSHMVWHLPEEVEEEEEGKNDRVPSVVEKVDRESRYNAQNARRVDKTTGMCTVLELG